MLKNRPFLMVLTGAALALILWLAVVAFQSNSVDNRPVETTVEPNATTSIPEEYAITPATVQTASGANGKIIVSGLGVVGAGISFLHNDAALANSRVDADGNWVLNFASGDIGQSAKIEILMATPDGHQVRSDQTIYILKNAEMRALLLLTEPGGQSRVLQTPFDGFPAVLGFNLEAIDYDNSGGVIFSGASTLSGKVRIYANDNQVGESRVDRNGRWTLIFGNIMPLGEYNITAEFVPDDGTQVKRLTLPFSRIAPLVESEDSPKLLVEKMDDRIQMGWALYGGGYQYTVVYAPDALIVPEE